jgi:hypothetical protein
MAVKTDTGRLSFRDTAPSGYMASRLDHFLQAGLR